MYHDELGAGDDFACLSDYERRNTLRMSLINSLWLGQVMTRAEPSRTGPVEMAVPSDEYPVVIL